MRLAFPPMRARRRPARPGGKCAPAGAQSPDKVAQAGEAAMREEVKVVVFHSALAVRDDGSVVIALFNGDPVACVAMLRGSVEAAESLAEVLGSALSADDS